MRSPSSANPVASSKTKYARINESSAKEFNRSGLTTYRRQYAIPMPIVARTPPNTSHTKLVCNLKYAVGNATPRYSSKLNSMAATVVAKNKTANPQKIAKCITVAYRSRRGWNFPCPPKPNAPDRTNSRMRVVCEPSSSYSDPTLQNCTRL